GEAAEAAAAERAGEGGEQGLPVGPGERSFGHGASPVSGPVGACHYPAGSDQEPPPSRRYVRSAIVPSYRETTAYARTGNSPSEAYLFSTQQPCAARGTKR